MYMQIEELKQIAPSATTMRDFAESLKKEEPTIILRDYNEPTSPPYLQSGVEIFDFDKNPAPVGEMKSAYGTRPNVAGVNVVNAVKTALGTGGYCLHISDSSYTGYTIWELYEFMRNFDNTNLRVWIPEVFDCDDFSEVLQGNVSGFFPGIAFGTIWYGSKEPPYWGHSVNIFYSYTDNKVYLVEPQSDVFYSFNQKEWEAWMVVI
ncbi:hypothetical protein NIES3974_33150 [Calothrix sp. NIES-3974]|nr:hypothetical protein NIES3974_33150 [Calothrix sp. NIES-3974]